MRRLEKITVSGLIVGVFLPCFSAQSVAAQASFTWATPNITAAKVLDRPSPEEKPIRGCEEESFFIGNSLSKDQGCVYKQDGFDYAFVAHTTSTWWGDRVTDNLFTIRFEGESRMHRVHNIPVEYYISRPVPQTRDILFNFSNLHTYGGTLKIIKDLPSKLSRMIGSDLSVEYSLKPDAYELLIKGEIATDVVTQAYGVSPNGKWAAVEIMGRGLVRVDMSDFSYRWFSRYTPSYGYGSDGGLEFAVTNDGKRIASAGINIEPRINEINETCGYQSDVVRHAWFVTDYNTGFCPEQPLNAYIYKTMGDITRAARFPVFNYDGGEVDVFSMPYVRPGVEFKPTWIRLSPEGYEAPKLAYLALGDSYSSGEGDLQKDPVTNQKFYRNNTDTKSDNDTPEEKCHLSTRSYPYLLAEAMGMKGAINADWQTVACSGALIRDDFGIKSDYLGQNNRSNKPRLDGFNRRISYQQDAINAFIPGRIEQLKFVKKYQPKILTLTGGGNDVGFGPVLNMCASSFTGCDYTNLSRKVSELGYAIKGEYQELVEFYEQIHIISPDTKVYVLGYPQFVSDEDRQCHINVKLDKSERKMVREGVSYLNKIIKAAATTSGVKYLDVENAFGDHILCGEGESYANGVNLNCLDGVPIIGLVSAFAGSDECEESYHPNHLGHAAIAAKVREQVSGDLLNYSYCTDGRIVCPDGAIQDTTPSAYFKWAMEYDQWSTNSRYATLASVDYAQKNGQNIELNVNMLEPGANINVYLLSDRVNLGAYMADSSGRLTISVPTPINIPAGYHTLYVEGKSFSGEPVILWQIVRILGHTGDIDEDGKSDVWDKCLFIAEMNIDRDGDGVDDACDAEIGPPVQLGASYKQEPRLSTGTVNRDKKDEIVASGPTKMLGVSSTEVGIRTNDILDKMQYDKVNSQQTPTSSYASAAMIGLLLGSIAYRMLYLRKKK